MHGLCLHGVIVSIVLLTKVYSRSIFQMGSGGLFSSLAVQDSVACLQSTTTVTTLHCTADYSISHDLHSSRHGGISLANTLLHYIFFITTNLCTAKWSS